MCGRGWWAGRAQASSDSLPSLDSAIQCHRHPAGDVHAGSTALCPGEKDDIN